MTELADKIEAAGGPSIALFEAAFWAVNPRYAAVRRFRELLDAEAWLDAAMTLVPDQHRAGVLHHAMQRIQQTGFPNSTFLQRLILEVVAAALRAGGTDE